MKAHTSPCANPEAGVQALCCPPHFWLIDSELSEFLREKTAAGIEWIRQDTGTCAKCGEVRTFTNRRRAGTGNTPVRVGARG